MLFAPAHWLGRPLRTPHLARRFNGTSDFVQLDSAMGIAYPFTVACWFMVFDDTVSAALVHIGDTAQNNQQYHALIGAGNAAGNPLRSSSRILASPSICSATTLAPGGGEFDANGETSSRGPRCAKAGEARIRKRDASSKRSRT